MGKGLKSKAGRILQMILLGANPNLFNVLGKRTICSNAEDYDYVESIEFDKLSRKGSKSLTANVPLEEMWQGKMNGPLHYNLIDDQILPFWVAKPTETPILVGAVNCIDAEYVRPQLDRADRAYFAIEEGKPGTPIDMGCYGLFTSFKWTSKRGNKGTSRFEVNFVTQAAVQRPNLTGGLPQNAILVITAANVTGDGVFSVTRQGQVSELLTIRNTDSGAAVKTAFEALNSIDGATVAGGIAPINEVQTLSAPGVTSVILDAQAGGTVQALNAGETMAILGNKVAAVLGKTAGDVVATGTSTAAQPAGYAVAGAATASVNGTYTVAGNFNGKPYYANSTPGGVLLWWNTANSQWNFSTQFTGGELYIKVGANPEGGVYSNVGSNANPPAPTVTLQNAAASVLNVTFTFSGASVAAQNIAQLTSATANVTLATTVQGTPGGSYSVTITNPTNTSISITRVSGAGWSATANQPGGDGNLLSAMLPEDPIMPGHLLFYSSTTAAGLDDPASLIGQIGEWELDDPKICMPVSHHIPIVDPERPNLSATYNAHAEEDAQEDSIKLSVTMDTDEEGVVDGMAGIVRASGAKTVSAPRYWRIVAQRPGSPRFVRVDFYGSIGSSAERKFGGVIEQRTFVFDLLENKEVGWNFKVKTRRPA